MPRSQQITAASAAAAGLVAGPRLCSHAQTPNLPTNIVPPNIA